LSARPCKKGPSIGILRIKREDYLSLLAYRHPTELRQGLLRFIKAAAAYLKERERRRPAKPPRGQQGERQVDAE
jgi:hypothetical protein